MTAKERLKAAQEEWRKTDLAKAAQKSALRQGGFQTDSGIPIPDLLLRLRDKGKREGAASPGLPPMGPWALLASQPAAWRAALIGGRLLDHLPRGLVPVPAYQAWTAGRTLPKWRGGAFRKWLRRHRRK